jgi:hypothetical protein
MPGNSSMEKKNGPNKKHTPLTKPSNDPPETPEIYIYDPRTKKWKLHHPSDSTAYNCLTRDIWSWLD